jgi:hypothetical protein
MEQEQEGGDAKDQAGRRISKKAAIDQAEDCRHAAHQPERGCISQPDPTWVIQAYQLA